MNKLCFESVSDKNSKVLILGSFPSEKSLKQGFYYGNKSNRFWKIIFEYFNENLVDDIQSKKKFLLTHKIALWDIVKTTNLKGSSDLKLQNRIIEINDISSFLQTHQNIKQMCPF